MKEHDFLVEIGTDELPSKILKNLGTSFFNYIQDEFKRHHISYNTIKWFASPRHLAITAKISIVKKNINYSNTTNNNSKNTIIQMQCSHKQCLWKENDIYNQNFKYLLINTVNNVLKKLMNYKTMRWGDIQIPFIRPIQTITMLLDSNLIEGNFFKIDINRISYGHRYIKNNTITINHAHDYPEILMKKGFVIVDYNMRKKIIQTEIEKQATNLGGVVDMKDSNFIDTITASIEWPVILFGRFNKRFLSLPPEVIVHIMKEHQKYFPVYNIIGGILLPCFIFVINTITNNYKKIISGHENILQTRFIDAEFFLKNDNRYRLEEYIPKLSSILFHRKLGNLRDKAYRIEKLSGWIAEQINEDILQAKRAGYLCKCDLITDMVLEFPKIQGIIGMYYARRDGESEKVAIAQKEHYQPQCIDNAIPTEKISCIVSIADKIDTISGIFGVQELPTSSRDPFALKRSASGILSIIIQKKIPLNLTNLIHESVKLYGPYLTQYELIEKNIKNFMYKRLCAYYLLQGYELDIIKSVLNIQYDNIIDCTAKIHTIHEFRTIKQQQYLRLHTIYKRISNILKTKDIAFSKKKIEIQSFLLQEPIEKLLFTQINNVNIKNNVFFKKQNYNLALMEIVQLSELVNNFLDNIIVMDKNYDIKINRLSLLQSAKSLISKLIDYSSLQI